MPFNPPSLQKPRNEYSQYDDSFVQIAPDADEATAKEHADRVAQCRETGDWSPLRVKDSPEPTIFEMRHIDGDVARALMRQNADYDLWFRAGLISVQNLGGATHVAKLVSVTNIPGKVADVTIPNLLDRCGMRAVTELGAVAMNRAIVLAPRR